MDAPIAAPGTNAKDPQFSSTELPSEKAHSDNENTSDDVPATKGGFLANLKNPSATQAYPDVQTFMTPAEERRILRKIDWQVMPLVTLLYL
jgi:hypothetical protein